MIVTLWGVRGSIPTPGPSTRRYGGNTTCVSVELDEQVLVFDAGTGIRSLGAALLGSGKEIFILLTHLHADHLQGFPFFAPLYEPGREVHLLDYEHGGASWSLVSALDGVHFPLTPEQVPGRLTRVQGDVLRFLAERGVAIDRLPVNHPGGAYGYRVSHGGRTVVFIPDDELRGPSWGEATREATVEFCRGADVLIHDAQYLSAEMPLRWGWGHSTLAEACELAGEAEVGHLVLFHHDPTRSDEMLDAVQEEGRALLEPRGIVCTAAYEGLTL